MQYILSEIEYKDLKRGSGLGIDITPGDLQRLCTRVRNEFPVMFEDKIRKFNCIITDRSSYCDDCVVAPICPYPYKEYSK